LAKEVDFYRLFCYIQMDFWPGSSAWPADRQVVRQWSVWLLSLKNNNFYIGSAKDVQDLFNQHNNGLVKSTKVYRP